MDLEAGGVAEVKRVACNWAAKWGPGTDYIKEATAWENDWIIREGIQLGWDYLTRTATAGDHEAKQRQAASEFAAYRRQRQPASETPRIPPRTTRNAGH